MLPGFVLTLAAYTVKSMLPGLESSEMNWNEQAGALQSGNSLFPTLSECWKWSVTSWGKLLVTKVHPHYSGSRPAIPQVRREMRVRWRKPATQKAMSGLRSAAFFHLRVRDGWNWDADISQKFSSVNPLAWEGEEGCGCRTAWQWVEGLAGWHGHCLSLAYRLASCGCLTSQYPTPTPCQTLFFLLRLLESLLLRGWSCPAEPLSKVRREAN